jgi:hypothetical protein
MAQQMTTLMQENIVDPRLHVRFLRGIHSLVFTLDSTNYHSVDTGKIRCACMEVVNLDDNGMIFETMMVAESLAQDLLPVCDTLRSVGG